jgi:hypothetical protein
MVLFFYPNFGFVAIIPSNWHFIFVLQIATISKVLQMKFLQYVAAINICVVSGRFLNLSKNKKKKHIHASH